MSLDLTVSGWLLFGISWEYTKKPDEHPFFPEYLPEPMIPPMQHPQVLDFYLVSC